MNFTTQQSPATPTRIFRDGDHKIRFYDSNGVMMYATSDRDYIAYQPGSGLFALTSSQFLSTPFYFNVKNLTEIDLDGTATDYGLTGSPAYSEPTTEFEELKAKAIAVYEQLVNDVFFECCPSSGGAGGSTTMTDFSGGNWKTFYTNGAGDVQELALGASGEVLTSNGASAAPSWQSVAGGKWFMEGSFTFVVGGGGTRYYLGATVGGINNHSKNYFIDPYTNIRVLDVYRAGIQIPFAVNNLSFKADVNSSVGSVNVIARLLKAARAADGTSYTNSITPTQIATTTKAIGSTNTVYHVDASSANSAASTDFLVFGLECDTAATLIDCSYTLYGDL